jgi:phage pi2 protein 07
MLIMSLIAPASSMNKTGEEEYSRSVATTNLFFNNKIRSYQSHTTQYINKFIRLYIYYSSLLRDKIREILELAESKMNTKREIEYDYGRSTEAVEDPSMGEGTEPEDAESEGSGDDLFKEDEKDEDEEERKHTVIQPQVKKAFKTNKGDIEENIRKVIQNVTIKLPAPRIVVDKAHFEEIQSYISTLDTILQAVYPDESTMGYEGYDKALTMLRACVKEEMIREYVQTLGFQSNYNMPTLEDIDFSHMEENMLKLINVIKGMGDIKKHIGDRVSPPEESGFGSSGFGGSPYGGSSPYGSEAGGGFGEEGGGEPPGLGDEGPSLDEGPQEPEGGEETTPAEQTEQSPGTGTQSTATT